MYQNFFGFSEEPFNLNLDPRFIFLTERHRKILSLIVYGIKERKGFILLTGEKGVGKTTLVCIIYLYLTTIDQKVKAIPIFQPNSTVEEYLETILRILRLPEKEGNRNFKISQLNDYMMEKSARGETLAVIFDEVHSLSRETLEDLRLLANPNPRRGGFLQEIFVGEPKIEKKLNSKGLRQLKQRIAIRCRLGPLTQDESRQYIEHRLNKVGSSASKVFTSDAAELISRYSRGNPRIINMICDKVLLAGFGQRKNKIDSAMVKEAFSNLKKRRPKGWLRETAISSWLMDSLGKSSFHRRFSYSLLALACLGIGIFLGGIYMEEPSKATAIRLPFPQLPLEEKFSSGGNFAVLEPSLSAFNRDSSLLPLKDGGHSKIAILQEEGSIDSLAKKYYGAGNLTIGDFILESNPMISNPHKINLNQQIILPEITDKSFILESSNGTFQVWLGTFLKPRDAQYLKEEPVLKGKEIEIIPKKLSTGEIWYRAITGKFQNVEECLGIISALKEKGALPAFEGIQAKEKG
jgi:general secretion pathway protein A